MDNITYGNLATGMRLTCPSNGPGTIYALHHEPQEGTAPDVQQADAAGVAVDVVFDNGSIARDVPTAFMRHTGWEVYDVAVSAECIARSLATAACATASRSAADAQQLAAYVAYNAEIERLRAAPEYHHLVQGNDPHSGALAARNIRLTLKLVFPCTRFSVRRTANGVVTVSYKDGPCIEQVDYVVRRYRAGCYDPGVGAYQYSRQPWAAVFGAAKYINVVHEESDDLIEKAINALFAKCPEILTNIAKPSVREYKGGALCRVMVPLFDQSLQQLVRAQVGTMGR